MRWHVDNWVLRNKNAIHKSNCQTLPLPSFLHLGSSARADVQMSLVWLKWQTDRKRNVAGGGRVDMEIPFFKTSNPILLLQLHQNISKDYIFLLAITHKSCHERHTPLRDSLIPRVHRFSKYQAHLHKEELALNKISRFCFSNNSSYHYPISFRPDSNNYLYLTRLKRTHIPQVIWGSSLKYLTIFV